MHHYLPSRPAARRNFRHFIGTTAVLGLLLGAGNADAQTLYGLGSLTQTQAGQPVGAQALITINPTNGQPTGAYVFVSGVPVGQRLVGLDYRPNTGQAFALGYDASILAASTPNAQLYTIDPASGVVTAVGAAIRLELGGATDRIGFDFNPTVDRIRVVSSNKANYRLNPNDGSITFRDGDLNYAGGSPANPGVGAVAYTNSYRASSNTVLYDFDELNGILATQNPPNNGVLINQKPVAFGPGGIGSPVAVDMDISAYTTPGTEEAFVMEVTQASGGLSSSNLYALDLATGALTLRGNTIPAFASSPFNVEDIAVSIPAPAAPAAITGQLLYAVAGGNLVSFDSNAPGVIRSAVNFGGGLRAGQTVMGIDFRPATGQLYALGYDATTVGDNAQVYTADLTTGALTAVGAPIRLELGGATDRVGFDFNPAVDRIRVVSTKQANYRLNPNDGSITLRDTDLTLAGIGAAAYTNNQSIANTTQLLDYNATNGMLYLQNPPNNGALMALGNTGLTAASADGADFDIYNTPGTSTNQGLLAVNTNPTAGRTSFDNLYAIDLNTAAVIDLGAIGQGTNVTGMAAFIAAGTGLTWNGSASTDWGTAANWTPAQVPAANNDVTIPSGTPNQPTVRDAQQARLVTLTANAVLTLDNGGTLTTGGNFTNNGGRVMGAGTGTLVAGGTAPVLGGTSLSTFPNLTTSSAASTAGPVAVQRALTLNGNLTVGANQPLTLMSSASGTAYVVNNGSAVVSGTATVQRYIAPGANGGAGYRHYAAPVSGSTVADLATGNFSPTVNAAYNTSATPAMVTPFPTVFGYSQSRLATTSNNLSAFDKGFASPDAAGDALAVGQGYAVNIGAGEVVDFVGTLNNGTMVMPLARNSGATAADAGWALLGNPYPAPLDYSLVTAGDRSNLDGAIYVYSSTSQYGGQYRSYTNGVGGNPVLPVGQGFFARVSAGQTSGSLTFRNGQRLTTDNPTPFQRPTTPDPRPQVQLELRGSTGPADAFYAYAEAGATTSFDGEYDAAKLPNTNGLNLAGAAANGEALAIDGRPVFAASTTLPLTVEVPAAGTYALSAAALSNLPAGLDAYLADDQTGQTLQLSTGTSYSFGVTAAAAAAPINGRFRLYFRPATPLATAPSLTAEVVSVYPNPARERFTVTLPGLAHATTVQADLLNNLGQVVRHQAAALPIGGAQLTLETSGLAAGVYTLRLQAGATTLAKRVVVQ